MFSFVRFTTVILLLAVAVAATAQKSEKQPYKFRAALAAGAGLSFAAGVANGVHETVHYHYDAFKARFPNANDQFWNPDESWKNKYKNGDPTQGPAYFGSATFLAWSTDAKHLMGTAHRIGLVAGAVTVTIGEKRPFWHYALDFVICGAAYSAGFHGTYSLFFKPENGSAR